MNLIRLMMQNNDVAIAIGVIGLLVVMLVPLPALMLDLFLSINITIALVTLLIVFYTQRAMEFSVFPSFLLLATLLRLSLNVASTRRILLYGHQGPEAAGRVIESFGKFVVGGNYVIGFVVFLILVIIQFVVITKGASRIAEVSARFTLDAMPMKLMSIETDLNAGLTTEDEARQRRMEISKEADFHGSMDGASKFVRGDAIAGLIITAVNILGGLVIGILQKGLPLAEAARTYTLLTVGDGLVSQIPALIISTSAGILVTRASSDGDLGTTLTSQFLVRPRPLGIAAVILVGLGIIPGLPTIPFFILAAVTGATAYAVRQQEEEVEPPALEAPEMPSPGLEQAELEKVLEVDPVSLVVGVNLVRLAHDEMLPRIKLARKQIAAEMGFVVPPIHILDNLTGLPPTGYEIRIRENVVARYEVMPNHYLAMEVGPVSERIEGIPTQEPVSQTPAVWIPESEHERAQIAGYLTVDAAAVLVTHLSELLKRHAHELLSRQDVQDILDRVEQKQPALVKDLRDLTTQASQGSLNVLLHKVLQNLLREGVPIRDVETILEVLSSEIPKSTNGIYLTERVRQGLARTICRKLADDEGKLKVITLDAEIEQAVHQWIQTDEDEVYLVAEPNLASRIIDAVAQTIVRVAGQQQEPVILCHPKIRPYFRGFLMDHFNTSITVLSHYEIASDTSVEVIANISLQEGDATRQTP